MKTASLCGRKDVSDQRVASQPQSGTNRALVPVVFKQEFISDASRVEKRVPSPAPNFKLVVSSDLDLKPPMR